VPRQTKEQLINMVLRRKTHGDAFRQWPQGYEKHIQQVRSRIELDYEKLGDEKFRHKYKIYIY